MWVIVAFLVIVIAVVLALLYEHQNEKRSNFVKKTSKKIAALVALNESTYFHKVKPSFEINKNQYTNN